jgi:hypothetical protein
MSYSSQAVRIHNLQFEIMTLKRALLVPLRGKFYIRFSIQGPYLVAASVKQVRCIAYSTVVLHIGHLRSTSCLG